MDKIYKHLLRLVLTALPLACVAALASCGFENEADGCPDNEPATVQISVSAGEIGDLNGTRVGGDENADQHEFMHSLYVYIVDGNGNIAQSFENPIATGYDEAATGDLVEWTSEPFELNPGTYTIYAFANFEGHTGIIDDNQAVQNADYFITSCFGENKNLDALDQFRLIDPAGKIKLTAGDGQAVFIPMSAKEQVQVTPTTTMLSVDLVRLVSKVKLTMPADDITQDAASLTFSNYSKNVPLLGELYSDTDENYSYNINSTYYGGRNASTTASLSSATNNNDGTITASLYVNETPPGDEYFTVTLNTGNSSNGEISTYVSSTLRTDIPRNTIYPLTLAFPDFAPQITWQSWEAGIGSVPVEVVADEKNYIVKIASGNLFRFSVTGVDNGDFTGATWNFVDDVTMQITNITNEGSRLSGAVSAGLGVGTQIPLIVTVNWTGSYADSSTGSKADRNFSRSYNVTIEIIDIWDTVYKQGTHSGSWRAYRLTPEVLDIHVKR